ncbi:HAD family hydrolase [Dactylosporangium aurantiacum]|uniref:HAD family hydrolase n=1 Tax=Dactylosporangium aurantiacum TaxID=35754 RepID=A0A9Q9IS92_9ACTN|nr:HAD-IIIC family phosphatase [Dactylosporangium aurantiacum]MDG6109113.1 HAD-IIIC family phosphatase [Dactylosporangium aurantiacum]UWZ58444.1 HAD family hydrolase [Dactylosporangium aurantiacum]
MTAVLEETPLARLRVLHNEGRIAAEYRAVPALLAEMTDPVDLTRAGQVLSRTDVCDVLAAGGATDADTVTVAITGHATLGTLVAPLTAQFARHGLLLRPHVGDFDAYIRDLQDPGSEVYTSGADLVLCVLDAQIVFDELAPGWTAQDVAAVTTAKLALLERLVTGYTERAGGRLVLNTVPLQRVHTAQLVDLRSRAALGIAWRQFNVGLLALAERHARVSVVDLDPVLAEGVPVHEPRMAVYAKAHLGDELLFGYAREVAHLARTVRGRGKKVLVLDLDNTVWGGVLGDDGQDGIEVATTFRGEAFGRFQRTVKQLAAQGVVLAISSKNDHEPVLAALREHPDMVLRDSDFARINANWNAKDVNIRDIAGVLNLGLDSMVFVDDSAFERGLVAQALPEVTVVAVDEEPALHVERLLADGWFDTLELTEEDRARGSLYRAEGARQELLDGSGSLADYLDQLGVQVTVSRAGAAEVARVAQLTLRTNQFNLTTERLDQADVQRRVDDPAHLVLAIRSGDRFGDNGVVGAVFAHRGAGKLHIDNVLLSCRVFARGIEQAALAEVLRFARDTGVTSVHATYRPTKKNTKVRDFYPSLGFETAGDDAGTLTFRRDLTDLPGVPGHLTLRSDLGTEAATTERTPA